MTGTSGGNGATAKRWRRITVVVILVAGLAAIIITNEHILLQSLHTLAHLNWWWVLAALVAEAISLTAFGISRVILLRAEGDQATLGTVMSITYAGNALSMAVPFAGAQLAAVFSYKQLRGRGLGPAITSWALAVSAIVSSAALALVLLAGAFLGGQPAATLAGLIGAAVFLVPGVTVLLALRYQAARAWIHRTLAVLLRPLHRRWGKSWMDPAALEEFLDRVASISLPGSRYALVFALALVNWLGDCGCLACSILATGAASALARAAAGLRRGRRGGQLRAVPGRVRAGRDRADGRADRGRDDRLGRAGRVHRLPADQFLADPDRRRRLAHRAGPPGQRRGGRGHPAPATPARHPVP